MKKIRGFYFVCDCEHQGDMDAAKVEVLSANSTIEVVNEYWDGRDCGDAYIEFVFPESEFLDVYHVLSDARFCANINDYVDVKISGVLGKAKKLSTENFKRMCDECSTILSNEDVYLKLFFEKNPRISEDIIIEKALKSVNSDTSSIVGVMTKIVDRDTYIHTLLKVKWSDGLIKKLKEFGNYCFDGEGWLHDNGIYGELLLVSIVGNDYGLYLQKVKAKEPIEYKNFRIFGKPKKFKYSEYMDGEHIKPIIELDGEKYKIR